MNIKGFSSHGNWYKGNLHCHTTDSDGSLTPAEVVQYYKKEGYDFERAKTVTGEVKHLSEYWKICLTTR